MSELNALQQAVFSSDRDLPKGWRRTPIRDLALQMFGGGTPSTTKPEYWDGDQPWTTTAIIKEDDIFLRKVQRFISKTGLDNSSAKIAPKGSVLIGTRVGVGKAAVTTFNIAINQDLTALIPNDKILPEFLALSLKEQSVQTWFENHKRGSTIKGVPREDLAVLEIPLPPLSGQHAIARVLRMVQQAKEATEKVIAATHQLKQSLMLHLFTYGPVPFDQADQILLRETPYGKVPAGWLQVPIGQCAYVQTGLAKGRKLSEVETVSLPYLRVANVQSGRLGLAEMKTIELRKQEINRYLLKDGDVVLTEGGDFDKLGRGFIWRNEVPQCIHQNHIFAVRASRTKLLPEFLAYLVQSDYGRSYFLSVAHKTTTLACINKTKLEAFPVLLPPLAEQRQIAMQFATVDTKLAAEETRRDALNALFRSLLHHLMTGKVRIHDLELPSVKEDAP
jgi:type I restriction enzyme S subunit